MAALETQGILRPVRFAPNGTVKSDPLFLFLFGFSVLLHGLILTLPVSLENRASSSLIVLPIQASIRKSSPEMASPDRHGQAQKVPGLVNPLPRERHSAQATTLRPAPPVLMNNGTVLPGSELASKPSFNLENLREQARILTKESLGQDTRGADRSRRGPVVTGPELMDRPYLDALAKRLGQPLRVMSEQVMNDGSRFIRFSGNTCLHIPRHLPSGRESEFTQTMLLPTNCPQ